MTEKIPLAIGIEYYKDIIDKPYYYVDKTLIIKELLDRGGAVNLFTRPRRFGKTLMLSMIKTYFEADTDINGNITDNRKYFTGKKIMQAGEKYTKHIGKYPVISLSLKSARQPDFNMAYESIKDEIIKEYERHRYILDENILLPSKCERYKAIMENRADTIQYATSLKFLSDCLFKYHNEKVIILIDEYDVPLENAYLRGYYEQMIDFIRSLFESALKTNESLQFAVITGCLRISRESIFTGLNNLAVISILNIDYAKYFGFTEKEVLEMLKYYEIEDKKSEVKKWYDGYLFGNTEVYNPWSIINYVKDHISDINVFLKPYWSNTSSNSIIRELIEKADTVTKQEIENLLAGGTIEKPVHDDITYEDIHKSQDNLWNFLFFTGYLKMIKQRFYADTIYLTMTIPNTEVKTIYRSHILEWFDNKIKTSNFDELYKAVINGDAESFSRIVSRQLVETISYFDYAENYYYGFLTGILKGCPNYSLVSNKESGNGRPDIVITDLETQELAVIIEIKTVKSFDDMENGCKTALKQINDTKYEESFKANGYNKFIKYGVCFFKKRCMIKCELY